jgi:hypothetical protein
MSNKSTNQQEIDKAKNLTCVIFMREKPDILSTKSDQLEWRRSKVVEMRARGLSHEEIAQQLQVSRTSITSDIQYLRSQAKESIKEYVTEHLPEQYQVCLTALDAIIKRAFDILETSPDNRKFHISFHGCFATQCFSLKNLKVFSLSLSSS